MENDINSMDGLKLLNEDQVFNAYKKLKHYFFYDNTSLFVRKKLAKFESEVFKGFDELTDLETYKAVLYDKVKKCFDGILQSEINLIESKDVDIHILPKKIKENKIKIITNNFRDVDKIEIERLNIYIDASIEVHIISTLWVMFVGRFLEPTMSQNSYANKMELNIDANDEMPYENFKLFKPYFAQYQSWRDDAVNKAESLLNEGKNVTILSLDIRNYYHNVKLDFRRVEEEVDFEIKKYFRNKELVDKSEKEFRITAVQLNTVLSEIHKSYYQKYKEYILEKDLNNDGQRDKLLPLPIGLLSSAFLGNYFLNDFDSTIINDLNPAFYGRYVDDLMFVFSDLKGHINKDLISPTLSFIDKNFVRKGIFSLNSDDRDTNNNLFEQETFIDKNKEEHIINKYINCFPQKVDRELYYKLSEKVNIHFDNKKSDECFKKDKTTNSNYELLKIQGSKVVLHYFDYQESRAVLNIFKRKLEEQRSEFRFLPDEDEISDKFDEEAFTLKYNDSVNKFRSIQDLSENKYGASKFLAKKIYAISFGKLEENDETDKQVLTFFKGEVAISFYSLWEKVATYYVVRGRYDLLLRFYRNVLGAISIIKFTIEEDNDLKNLDCKNIVNGNLMVHLQESIAMALCLNSKIDFLYPTKIESEGFERIRDSSFLLKKANLFRTSLISLPSLNYDNREFRECNFLENDFNSYSKISRRKSSDTNIYELSENDLKPKTILSRYSSYLAPTYVPFHELNILEIFSTVTTIKGDKTFNECNDEINSISNMAFIMYHFINFRWKSKQKSKDKIKEKYFSDSHDDQNDISISYVNIFGDNQFDTEINKKIAIANTKVVNDNVLKSILNRPNLTRERRKELFDILNQADANKSDLIVFPEVSVPYSWIKLLAERSQKRFMGIVAGLEHWVNQYGVAFNLMVTVLPFRSNEYSTSLIKVRLKNHYSPSEKELLRGYRLSIPEAITKEDKKAMSYHLFQWRKTYFSVYNCFELANIQHRSLFKSKVDFIIASEYNKDIDYFSDIAGAWVRDVHSYFIQVNTSNYGDSRLLQPSKSYIKDLIQVKGGLNSTVLVDNLNIKKLRDFQLMEYNLQKTQIENGNYDFKPTPPDFERENVKIRINNASFYETIEGKIVEGKIVEGKIVGGKIVGGKIVGGKIVGEEKPNKEN